MAPLRLWNLALSGVCEAEDLVTSLTEPLSYAAGRYTLRMVRLEFVFTCPGLESNPGPSSAWGRCSIH